ncbi:MAG: GNAT family N-acetyltransferase [Clostridia bacterium]|nr:GNAT family N-acetyltransferase [Clostridia bacterium]
MEFKYIPQDKVTEDIFSEVMAVESSRPSGYDEENMRAFWQTSGKNDNFVCTENGKIVGHISFNPNSKRRNGSIFMVNLTVHPEYTKRGIAQNLILTACKHFISLGFNKVMATSVDKDNFPAVSLYLKSGFEIREPVCEADEDDEQYIMDNSLVFIKNRLEQITKGKENE